MCATGLWLRASVSPGAFRCTLRGMTEREGGRPAGEESPFKRTAPAGTVLFQAGDAGAEMFVIHSGKVALTRRIRGQELPLVTLGKGDFFGELAILTTQPRSATATVVEDAELLAIDSSTLASMLRGSTDIAVRLLRKLAERLSRANAQVEVLLRPDTNYRIVHHLWSQAEGQGAADELGVTLEHTVETVARGAGVSVEEARKCLERLERARLVKLEPGTILVPRAEGLVDFLEFLELGER